MKSKRTSMLIALTGAVAAALLAACSGAPGEAEFIAACMKEGESVVAQRRDRQMGVNRDAFCKCATQEAKATLNADGMRATMLSMQGKKEEARAITGKMSGPEQEAHMLAGLSVMKKCIGGPR